MNLDSKFDSGGQSHPHRKTINDVQREMESQANDRSISTRKSYPGAQVLIVSLPFWTSLIPPPGPACLKGSLQAHGYRVTAVDANVEDQFKDLYNEYFQELAVLVPEEKRGNFYSIGHEVLRNHLMVHLNHRIPMAIELSKTIGEESFGHKDSNRIAVDNLYEEHRSENQAFSSSPVTEASKSNTVTEDAYLELVQIIIQATFFCQVYPGGLEKLDTVICTFYKQLGMWWRQLIQNHRPGILGISVYSDTLPASLFAFSLTRQEYPHIVPVMGGGVFADLLAPGSANLEVFLEKTASTIDKIIIGEGELLFLKWLQGELPESQRLYTLADLKGKVLDLKDPQLPIPDFSDFNIDYYPYMTTYISRSCPFQCRFCAETVNWGPYRRKKIPYAVQEMIHLYKQYGYQLFLLGDSLLNPITTELSQELIQAEISFYWDGYLRADLPVCDTENTMLWRRGGFYRARLGIESGSPRVLEAMAKKISLQQIETAVSSLAYAGIKTTTYWIMGYPGETEADFQQTLDLVTQLKDNIYEAECKPFYYYPIGQAGSDDWFQHQRISVYPGNATDLLMLKTWRLDCLPSREETYQRVHRFLQHCKILGIPNPYSLNEIYNADQRWQKLHKNAVPPLIDLRNKHRYISENREVKTLHFAQALNSTDLDEDFGF